MVLRSLLALLCGILISAASEHVVYPAGGGNCPTPPCLTLDDYLSHASHYFTNHSSFLFLPGQHSLNTTLQLENLENVTLRATEAGATITVSLEGVIMCNSLNDLTISSLEMWYRGTAPVGYSFISAENSNSLSILNTHFFGINSSSFALYWIGSTGCVANCSFSSFSRSAITAIRSKISFNHVNFVNNILPRILQGNFVDSDFSGHVFLLIMLQVQGGRYMHLRPTFLSKERPHL